MATLEEIMKGPWEYDNVQLPSEQSAYGVVKTANGKVLFDAINSEVSEIHTEYDEGCVHRWDETARHALTLAAVSPDLLREVELFAGIALIESPNTRLGGWDWKGIHERLTALLAKARGQV